MRNGYITNLEDLQFWFEKLNHGKWSLYRGHIDKMIGSALIYRQDNDDLGINESFELMKEMIIRNSGNGGQFTIYVPYRASNHGASVRLSYNMPAGSNPLSAISGMGAAYGMGMVPADEIDRRIQKERETWELQRKVEDLEDTMKARMSFWDRLLDKVCEEVDLNQVITSVSGMLMQKKVPVSLHGSPYDFSGESAPGAPAGEGRHEYDIERVETILDKIRPHFETDDAFYTFIDALASGFAANPSMYKAMIPK